MNQPGSFQWQSSVASHVQVPDGICLVARPDGLVREGAAFGESVADEVQERVDVSEASATSETTEASEVDATSNILVDQVRRAVEAVASPSPALGLLSGSEGFSHLGAMAPCVPANTPEIVIVSAGEEDSLLEEIQASSELDGHASEGLEGDATQETPSQVCEVVSAELAMPEDGEVESVAKPDLATVRAAWEVDAFQWPVVTTELLEGQPGVFSHLYRALGDLGDGADRLALTSALTGEGRSTLSICLARWAAAQGHRTLLVDADFEHGNLSNLAGLEFESGWQQMASEVVPVEEFLVACDEVPLTLMCLQPSLISADDEIATAKKLGEIVSGLRSSFDVIILDCGTTSEVERLFGGVGLPADLGVVVRGLEGSGEAEMFRAQQALKAVGLRHLAIADNFGHRHAA